jgi:hypothetical protein
LLGFLQSFLRQKHQNFAPGTAAAVNPASPNLDNKSRNKKPRRSGVVESRKASQTSHNPDKFVSLKPQTLRL